MREGAPARAGEGGEEGWGGAVCRVSHLHAVYVNLAAAGAGAMSYYRTLGQRAR